MCYRKSTYDGACIVGPTVQLLKMIQKSGLTRAGKATPRGLPRSEPGDSGPLIRSALLLLHFTILIITLASLPRDKNDSLLWPDAFFMPSCSRQDRHDCIESYNFSSDIISKKEHGTCRHLVQKIQDFWKYLSWCSIAHRQAPYLVLPTLSYAISKQCSTFDDPRSKQHSQIHRDTPSRPPTQQRVNFTA